MKPRTASWLENRRSYGALSPRPQNIPSLAALKKRRRRKQEEVTKALARDWQEAEAHGKWEVLPVDVAFSLPRFTRSAGEVAAARPRPRCSPPLVEARRHKLKFPRMKVKEAVAAVAASGAARVAGLEVAAPKVAVVMKAAPKGEAARKASSRFTVPFPKRQQPSAEGGIKAPAGFQAPQVEFDLPPLPRVRPGRSSPEASAKGEGFQVQALKVSTAGLQAPEGGFQVAAPKVDLDLSLPKLEGVVAPDIALKGEGLMTEMKVPTAKAPALDFALGLGRGEADGLEEELKARLPLDVRVPSVDVEMSLPKGKADVEYSRAEVVSVKVPQVELWGGKQDNPKVKAKDPWTQVPTLGISLVECKSEGSGGATVPVGSQMKFPGVKVPSLEVSAPQIGDVHLSKLSAPAPGAKTREAAAEPGGKVQMPQVSLPKFDILPKTHAKLPAPEGDVRGRVSIPTLELTLPAAPPSLAVQRPKAACSQPVLAIAVDRPKVPEVALPSARLSFPSATRPALEIGAPQIELELDLPKVEGDPVQLSGDYKVKTNTPALESMSKDLEVELSVPMCRVGKPELEPRVGGPPLEESNVSGIVAKVPKVELATGIEPPASQEEEGWDLGGKLWPKVGHALEAKVKLPGVELATAKLPDATLGSGKLFESEAKLKPPKFALPKFSISGPKMWKRSGEASALQAEVEGPDIPDKASKLKMPKFGIFLPKAKWVLAVEGPRLALGLEGKAPQERVAPSGLHRSMECPEGPMKVPSTMPKGAVAVGKGGAGASPQVSMELKVPKFSLPTFGGKGKEGELDFEVGKTRLRGSREALAGEGSAKELMPKFKMPTFSMALPGAEGDLKVKNLPRSSLPKAVVAAEADQGQLDSQCPGLAVKGPQVELPKMGVLLGSGGLQKPTLEIASPGSKAEEQSTLGKPLVELRIPHLLSIGACAPQLELDVNLPSASPGVSMPHEATRAGAKIKLPKFGRVEAGGLEAEGQLLAGRRLSLGKEGEEDAQEAAGGSILGTKVRMPQVDISLPTTRLADVTGAETAAAEEPGEKFKIPSVSLPKFSTPKVKAPEVVLDSWSREVGKVPQVKLPKFWGGGSDGEGEAEMDLPSVPQLELKAPKLRGSTERPATETGVQEVRIKGPGFGLSKGEEAAVAAAYGHDSRLKLKLPAMSISKGGAASKADTQPLCPSVKGVDFSFKMPQLAFPAVGFSTDQGGGKEAKADAGGLAGIEDLELDVGGLEARLKMPQIKMPTFGAMGPRAGRVMLGSSRGDPEGGEAMFKMPGVEIAAPSLKAHAEYEVEGAQVRPGGPQQLEGTGKGEGKKYKAKLPSVVLALPNVGQEVGEGAPLEQVDAKIKRPLFVLGRPKGRGTEGSSGLLVGEGAAGGKGVMAKLKRKPHFGLSLAKPALGMVVNGEPEEGGAAQESSKRKLPKLGFAKAAEGGQLDNGAQDSRSKRDKVHLPQVELSPLSKTDARDQELNLHLVRVDEALAKEGGGVDDGSTFTALKPTRFKAPKLSLSGVRKRSGEDVSEGVVFSAARTEMASLENSAVTTAKAEKSPKFKLFKLSLSPKSHGVLEITSEPQVRLPQVGFSEEEQSCREAAEGPVRVAVVKAEGQAAAV